MQLQWKRIHTNELSDDIYTSIKAYKTVSTLLKAELIFPQQCSYIHVKQWRMLHVYLVVYANVIFLLDD